MHAPIRLGLLLASLFGVVNVLGVISSVCASKLQGSPPHLCLYLVLYSKTKDENTTNGSTGFKNQGALKFIGAKFYSHHEMYSNKAELMLHQHENVVQHESSALTYIPL